MLEPEPLRWSAHTAQHAEGPTEPLGYTAPGGWLILPLPRTVGDEGTSPYPDRPWKLVRHGQLVEWCHTLRIAKHTANRMTTAEGAHP